MNVMPRNRIRLRFKDMKPGEIAWAGAGDCRIDQLDFSVWLRTDGGVQLIDGQVTDMFSFESSRRGTFLVERTASGYAVHVYGDAAYGVDDFIEGWQEEGYTRVDEIIDHGPAAHTCDKCKGRGLVIDG